ncbi:uncharacterized protein LOC127716575 isoform X1 [Mytilus californianus]|uniref:uncharacterized protein LOC127716575 isoform X1 n=1 Tax=Mytilus californianus TaxID=6549 RepID=UPI0022483A26|nr:uncharacterized protein LOC127716575 isoform X1 [Mytilus californianus]
MIMVTSDYVHNFTTTSVYSIVILFLWIISLSSAEYNLTNGETGKYRWFDTAAQIHRVCCYCPIEAVSSDKYNDAFQRYDDKDGDFCNPSEDEIIQTGKYPFCICEHKMGLKPEFIGCVLPNKSHVSHVEWTCDNVFTSLNVSVYTTCNPRCTKDSMVLVNPGAKSYRCGEKKTWDNQPKFVYCRDKNEDDTENWVYMVIGIVPASIIIAVILIMICRKRLWHHCCLHVKKEICSTSSSEDSSSSRKEILAMSVVDSKVPDSSFGSTNDNMTIDTQLSITDACSIIIDTSIKADCEYQGGENVTKIAEDEERKSNSDPDEENYPLVVRSKEDLIREENVPLIKNDYDSKPAQPLLVKVSGLRESYRDDGIYYSVIRGNEIIIVTKIVETDSDFIIDRDYDEHKLNYYKIISASKNNEGVYNWQLKDNSKQGKQTGSFNITLCDKERPEPVGESTLSLQYNRLGTDSMLTVEENLVEVDCPGSPSLPDEAVCVRERNSPFSSNNSNGANITSSEKCDAMPQNKIGYVEECKSCNLTLTDALHQYCSSNSLRNICQMLDPTTISESHCWIGFVKFYGLMEGFRIKNIEYHKKGNPEDGHMQHILQQLLPPLDFRVGHLVYYFSQKDSLREDVLYEIKKFHNNCKFCDMLRNCS